ncbi:MAG: hypothetical protein Q4G36_08325 [Paracoccus sp. (in: a-proteobacteria)]|nr:hypothetical protein [Paracoccus sp. (in: a-proteobacteria)]
MRLTVADQAVIHGLTVLALRAPDDHRQLVIRELQMLSGQITRKEPIMSGMLTKIDRAASALSSVDDYTAFEAEIGHAMRFFHLTRLGDAQTALRERGGVR